MNCNNGHTFSRLINQPRPRRCVHCGTQEAATLHPKKEIEESGLFAEIESNYKLWAINEELRSEIQKLKEEIFLLLHPDPKDKWWGSYKFEEDTLGYFIPNYKIERFKISIEKRDKLLERAKEIIISEENYHDHDGECGNHKWLKDYEELNR